MKLPLIQPYVDLLKRNKQYRWLWLSQVISLIGDWFNLIASTTLVASVSNAGLAISGVFVARLLPPFLLGPIVGVVADRFDRKKILIFSDLFRMVVVLGFLLVRSESDIWLLYVLTLIQLSISAFFEPTRSALTPGIVAKEDLVLANALSGTTWSSMLAIGAALGGFATAMFGVTVAFLIDAATFAVSAIFLFKVTIPQEARLVSRMVPQNGFRDYIDGLKYLWYRPHTLVLTLVKGAAALSFGAIDVAQVQFAEDIFPIGADSAAALGLIYIAIGIGTGLAPLIANRYTSQRYKAMIDAITWSFVLSIIGFGTVAWSPTLGILLLGTIVRAAGSGISWVFSSALLQIKVPNEFRGRVFAFDLAIYTLASTASTWGGGYVLDKFGVDARGISLIAAIIGVIVFGLWLAYTLRFAKKVSQFTLQID